MNCRNMLFAGAMLLPALGLAQGVKRPPLPAAAPQPQPGAAQGQGTLEAPAGLPQPSLSPQTYAEWLKSYYHIYSIPKKNAILLGGNRVRPNQILNMVLEIVGENGEDYLVRNLPPEDPQAVGHVTWLRNEKSEISQKAKIEYLRNKWLIVDNPDVPPPFTDKVKFVEADKGLPKGGRWQISFDLADMNGDGRPDLVFGPARTATKLVPHIFAQLEDHSWAEAPATWPTQGVKLDYGTVRVADFDGDGNKDIAIACHLSKTYVLYGDGKGGFTRFVTIPQANPTMTARALTVADFNNDGRPDIASYAELDINMANAQRLTSGLVNIALNLPSGWKAVGEKSFPEFLMGDHLTTADIDMDGNQDLLLTSRASNVMTLIFRNLGGGEAWQPIRDRRTACLRLRARQRHRPARPLQTARSPRVLPAAQPVAQRNADAGVRHLPLPRCRRQPDLDADAGPCCSRRRAPATTARRRSATSTATGATTSWSPATTAGCGCSSRVRTARSTSNGTRGWTSPAPTSSTSGSRTSTTTAGARSSLRGRRWTNGAAGSGSTSRASSMARLARPLDTPARRWYIPLVSMFGFGVLTGGVYGSTLMPMQHKRPFER